MKPDRVMLRIRELCERSEIAENESHSTRDHIQVFSSKFDAKTGQGVVVAKQDKESCPRSRGHTQSRLLFC